MDMLKNEKVTIVMPLFNGASYLEDTVKSVLNQSYSNFQLIIVDDRSTDSSYEIAKRIQDTRVVVMENEENLGLIGNWNKCLDLALEKKNLATLLICQDDIMEEDDLQRKIKILIENKDIVLVSNATKVVNSDGKKILIRKSLKE